MIRFQIFYVSSFTGKDTVPPKTQHVLANTLFSKSVQDMKVKFDMTTRQKAVLGCLQAAHARDFLLAILIDGLGQHISLVEYRTNFRYRLVIPLFWEHVVQCKELPILSTSITLLGMYFLIYSGEREYRRRL